MPHITISRSLRHASLVSLVSAGVLACSDAAAPRSDCGNQGGSLVVDCFLIMPITVGVGDTSSAALRALFPGATFTWSDGDTAVARIAGVTAGGVRVVVRGVEVGTTAVKFQIAQNGQSLAGSVPVQVVARAAAMP